jgi:hypothetical protein
MPRTCWGERMFPHLSRYAEKTHRELFEESRRPIDSISPEHLEYLWAEMERQKRFRSDPKSRWEDGDGD